MRKIGETLFVVAVLALSLLGTYWVYSNQPTDQDVVKDFFRNKEFSLYFELENITYSIAGDARTSCLPHDFKNAMDDVFSFQEFGLSGFKVRAKVIWCYSFLSAELTYASVNLLYGQESLVTPLNLTSYGIWYNQLSMTFTSDYNTFAGWVRSIDLEDY